MPHYTIPDLLELAEQVIVLLFSLQNPFIFTLNSICTICRHAHHYDAGWWFVYELFVHQINGRCERQQGKTYWYTCTLWGKLLRVLFCNSTKKNHLTLFTPTSITHHHQAPSSLPISLGAYSQQIICIFRAGRVIIPCSFYCIHCI